MKFVFVGLVFVLVVLGGFMPAGAYEELPFESSGGAALHSGGGGPLAIDFAVIEGDSVRFTLFWVDANREVVKQEPLGEVGSEFFTSYYGLSARRVEFVSPGPDSLAVDMLSSTKALATWK